MRSLLFRGDILISNEIMLLKLVKVNGSLSLLRKRGLTHAQIAMLLQKQISSNYVVITESGVLLTELGEKTLNENLVALKYKAKDSWILPQDSYYKKPLPKNTIILPKKI